MKRRDSFNLVREGKSLEPAEAAAMEARLTPRSVNDRFKLLGYYEKHRHEGDNLKKYLAHFLWLIDHRPADSALQFSTCCLVDDENFRIAKHHWDAALKKAPLDLRILNNAAHFCSVAAPATAERLWQQAEEIEPQNEEWPVALNHLHWLQTRTPGSDEREMHAKKAIEKINRAAALQCQQPGYRLLTTFLVNKISDTANMALSFGLLRDASLLGQLLIDEFSRYVRGKDDYDRQFMAHIGHSIVGRAALANGEVDTAKQHLQDMCAFDPAWKQDMLLARELLSKGEHEAVLSYLEGCKSVLFDELKRLESQKADPYQLPAWISMQRDQIDPSMEITDLLKNQISDKIEQLTEWQKEIELRRKLSLPDALQ